LLTQLTTSGVDICPSTLADFDADASLTQRSYHPENGVGVGLAER
jgi:hypothetical protein